MKIAPLFHPTRSKYLVFTWDFIVPSLLIFLIVALGWATLFSPIFHISQVICTLDYQDCQSSELLAELERVKGQNIFRLDVKKLAGRLTSADFTIREAKITRQLPATIRFTLQSVYPVVALKVVGQEEWAVLDSGYRVIKLMLADPNVPTVIVPGPLTLVIGRSPTDEQIVATLALARKLADELISVQTVTLVSPDTIELSLPGNLSALLTPQKDPLTQLRSLQALLTDATIMQGVRLIDMRFSQPVLR